MSTTIATARVIIVGAGLGALYAALKLAPRPVLMISPEALGQGASSAWAQGGVAAAMDPADSPEAHARDTLRAGAGTVDAEVADLVTHEARQHILDLTRLGTPFDRKPDGSYVMSREAAHGAARWRGGRCPCWPRCCWRGALCHAPPTPPHSTAAQAPPAGCCGARAPGC